jgi:hypothetical protein
LLAWKTQLAAQEPFWFNSLVDSFLTLEVLGGLMPDSITSLVSLLKSHARSICVASSTPQITIFLGTSTIINGRSIISRDACQREFLVAKALALKNRFDDANLFYLRKLELHN